MGSFAAGRCLSKMESTTAAGLAAPVSRRQKEVVAVLSYTVAVGLAVLAFTSYDPTERPTLDGLGDGPFVAAPQVTAISGFTGSPPNLGTATKVTVSWSFRNGITTPDVRLTT